MQNMASRPESLHDDLAHQLGYLECEPEVRAVAEYLIYNLDDNGFLNLELRDLSIAFDVRAGPLTVIPGLSLTIARGEAFGLVGESGCGKTMLGSSLIRLLPPGGRIVAGEVALDGRDLARLPAAEMRKVRGGDIGMVFQDPMTSLDPTMPIGRQIAESVQQHRGVSRKEGLERAAEVLSLPVYPELTDEQCESVIDAIRAFYA